MSFQKESRLYSEKRSSKERDVRRTQPAFDVDTCASQCYKTPKASPLVVSLLAHLNQRVRPQTCLAGQGCKAA